MSDTDTDRHTHSGFGIASSGRCDMIYDGCANDNVLRHSHLFDHTWSVGKTPIFASPSPIQSRAENAMDKLLLP